jgi:hypothetical protein
VKNLRLFGYFPVTRINKINIYSRISPRIFEKILNGFKGILGGLVDTDS